QTVLEHCGRKTGCSPAGIHVETTVSILPASGWRAAGLRSPRHSIDTRYTDALAHSRDLAARTPASHTPLRVPPLPGCCMYSKDCCTPKQSSDQARWLAGRTRSIGSHCRWPAAAGPSCTLAELLTRASWSARWEHRTVELKRGTHPAHSA